MSSSSEEKHEYQAGKEAILAVGRYSELQEIRDAVLPADLRQRARVYLGEDIVNVVGNLLDTVAIEATNYGTKSRLVPELVFPTTLPADLVGGSDFNGLHRTMRGRAASDEYTSEIQYVSLELAHALESAAETGFICGRHGSTEVALRVADQPDLVFVQTGEILTRRQSAAEYLAQIDLSATGDMIGVDYEDPQEIAQWRQAVESHLGALLPSVRPVR